ncbi:MAG: hypothetical protein K2L02_02225 [Clostridia bacterium]|nr:hypothetical protein [Clostridia bacterium]
MDEKKFEDKLKEEADRIQMEEFSSRFERVQPRIEMQETEQEEALLVKETVLKNGSMTGRVKRVPSRSLLLSLIFALLCIAILAIVLPLTLNREAIFRSNLSDLQTRYVSEEEFYQKLQSVDIEVSDFSIYEVEKYGLHATKEGVVKGGYVDYYDDGNTSFVGLNFYSADVEVDILSSNFQSGSLITEINGTKVQYLIVEADEEGAYRMLALANYKGYTYSFEILSDNENIFSVFETLFM